MRRYRMIILAALLLPMLSFSAESFAELLKREISGFAKEYFELQKPPFQEEDKEKEVLLRKLNPLCYECGYKKETDSYKEGISKEISEVLLRKYSGKIGNDEVSFFLQIDKDSRKILNGVISLSNEPMIPLKLLKILGDEELRSESKSIGIELSPNLELQIIFDRKLTTLSPQCPAQNLCSYVADSQTGIYFFPDLHIAIFDSGRYDDELNMLEAKSYEEAKKILSYESWFNESKHSFLIFVNDRYMSFGRDIYVNIEDTLTTGVLFDIKTKQFVSLSINSIRKESATIPKSIYEKYSYYKDNIMSIIFYNDIHYKHIQKEIPDDDNDCSLKEKTKLEELNEVKVMLDEVGYFDGYHYSYSEEGYVRVCPPTTRYSYNKEYFIPLKELKPYIKPEWYNYLIGKGELPKLREKAKLPELP